MALKSETKKMLMTIQLLAIAIVLDLVISAIPGLNASMPFGGKFFGLSMFPLVIIGILFGLKYGLLGGLIYAIYNFGFDYLVYIETLRVTLESWTGQPWSLWKIIALILFDYVIPFTAFGLSGLFHHALSTHIKMISSILFVSGIRLVSATISGVILWSSSIDYAMSEVQSGGSPNIATRIFAFVGESLWVYSLIYNLIYITTTTALVILIGVLIRKRLVQIVEPQVTSL